MIAYHGVKSAPRTPRPPPLASLLVDIIALYTFYTLPFYALLYFLYGASFNALTLKRYRLHIAQVLSYKLNGARPALQFLLVYRFTVKRLSTRAFNSVF